MIRALAKWAAKKYYVFNQEFQASTADLHAGLSLRLAGEKRELIEKLNKEADDIEANIKAVDEKLATGYWECENGHEEPQSTAFAEIELEIARQCSTCHKPMKMVRRDLMTGQEKYESDREKAEAQKIATNKRAQAKAEEENAAGSEQTAKYFQDQAKNNRTIAERIRSL
jgi:hypothetical protein